jgi:hypothetical protein
MTKAGYVGFTGGSEVVQSVFSDFDLNEDLASLTIADLVQAAFAYADYHEGVFAYDSPSSVIATAWGPNTDAPDVSTALTNLLKDEGLSLVYRDGVLVVDQFSATQPTRSFSNEILDQSEDNSAERVNIAIVDGNEHTYTAVDVNDIRARDVPVVSYFDLPELLDLATVEARANQELIRSRMGTAPSGKLVLPFDVNQMDVVTWIDRFGTTSLVRVEGMAIDIDQGKSPHQWMTVTTSLVAGDIISRLPAVERSI